VKKYNLPEGGKEKSMSILEKLDKGKIEEALEEMKSERIIGDGDIAYLLKQKMLFDEKWVELEQKYPGKVIAVCNDEFFIGDNFDDAVSRARKKFPDKMYYAKNMGLYDYPVY